MLEIKHVDKSFGKFQALNNVSIQIGDGEIHGIIGENGAGKTTIIKSMIGIYGIDAGEITLDGEHVFENPGAKAKIGYIADNNQYLAPYTAKQMIKFYSRVYKTFSADKFHEFNEIFQMEVDKKIGYMSKGQQMRTSIMLNLAVCPKLLVMDEPTSGLDVIAKRDTMNMVIQEARASHMSVFISSHHLDELEYSCDKITILRKGEVKQQDTLENILSTIRKFQIVFLQDAPAGFEEWPEFISFKKYESVYHVVVDNYTDELKQRILESGASLIQELRMELEEVFSFSKGA